MSTIDYPDTQPATVTVTPNGGRTAKRETPEQMAAAWRERIHLSRVDRRRYEPTWLSNLAFAAGKQWLKWNDSARRLEMPGELQDKELYTADVITEYRMTALGELGSDDDRPQLLLIRDGDEWDNSFQRQINNALAHAWDHETRAEEVLTDIDRLTLDLGTAAVRCRFDPSAGSLVTDEHGQAVQFPVKNGRPVTDLAAAHQHVAAMAAQGGQAQFQEMNSGCIRLEPLSAFNLLVPPGIPHERDFPWEIVVLPTSLEAVKDTYGAAADGLAEDSNIGSVLGVDANQQANEVSAGLGGTPQSKLRGYVWLYRCYERPCAAYPQGRVVTLGGQDMRFLRVENKLPYRGPDGVYRSGITYFHWQRVTGRFFSRSMVEALKDGQRRINRRATQTSEIIDKGMPFVLMEEGSLVARRSGTPFEIVNVKKDARAPVVAPGTGAGQWMYEDIKQARDDLEHASGIRGVRLGENPPGVSTYSQLALLSENDQVKREPIFKDRKLAIARMVENIVYDIRTYWGPDKQILLSDEEDRVDASIFDATKTPAFFIVKVAKGSTKPRSQAAMLKLVEDIATYSLNSGHPLPPSWLKESYEAGQPLDLPEDAGAEQQEKASLENHFMQVSRQPYPVSYYDPPDVHIPIHRGAQIQAELTEDHELWQVIEAHVQAHLQAAKENAMAAAQAATPSPSAGLPGGAPLGGQPAADAGAPPIPFSVPSLGGPSLDIRPQFPQNRYGR